jgi:hypothetical protein
MQAKINHLHFFGLLTFLIVVLSCSSSKNKTANTTLENCDINKIKFNLNMFDKQGLVGEDGGKVALDYEFCVPNNPEILNTIKEIDSSIKPTNGKGRTKCTDNSILLTGNSYGKDIKRILCELSQLEYIKTINQVYWE